MSKILEDITTNKITVSECLQRLLVIANKTANEELAQWCSQELKGYQFNDDIPEYRKMTSSNIIYSGFYYNEVGDRVTVNEQPIQNNFFKKETMDAIKKIKLYVNIVDVEKRMSLNEPLYRNLTYLTGEVYHNTHIDCISIQQVISQEFYTQIFMEVKTRIINLLCFYEEAGIKIDKVDIAFNSEKISKENKKLYQTIIVEGKTYSFENSIDNFIWRFLVPILVGVISYFSTKQLDKLWLGN